ncbi:MAG: DUF4349 domain-containing protein [Bacteroidota bacterium]
MSNYTGIWLSLLLLLSACYQNDKAYSESVELEEYQVGFEPPPPPPPPSENAVTAKRQLPEVLPKASKIIKDGEVLVEVTNLIAAKVQLDSTLTDYGAYYERENFQQLPYRSVYHLTIRIPSGKFENFLNIIESETGKVVNKTITARDVTDEYVDISIRLQNNKNYLNQYQALLKKASSIKDILEIQEKSRIIEEEIDSRTGRLKYMDDKVRFSTLRLELYQEIEPIKVEKSRNFVAQLGRSFKNGIDGFLDFLLAVVSIWPFILLIGALLYFRKRIRWKFWKR